MTTNVGQIADQAHVLEQKLAATLADRKTTNVEVASQIQEYRGASERILYTDLNYAHQIKIEDRLWDAHTKVKGHFRKQLAQSHRSGKQQAAEVRSLQKQFLEFIKTSQRFYRQYILRLDVQFGGIPELRQVAQRWKDENSKQPLNSVVSTQDKQQILLSCHQTLIHLGDLSRYREAELGGLGGKERNWGPAIGYYTLAVEIYPDSGTPHNQQAVIARNEGNHFRTLYHLYRSLSAKIRHPLAKQNLELEFKKILSSWKKGELIKTKGGRDSDEGGQALVAWFIRLHSGCYKGEEFSGHEELEREVLGQLVLEVRESALNGKLLKLVMINVAAEHFATIQLQENNCEADRIMKAYFKFLRLNLKTLSTLLQTFRSELDSLSDGKDVKAKDSGVSQQLSDRISSVSRRILPALRLYSSWLLRYWVVLNANVADTISEDEVRELWRAYAGVLTVLAAAFPADVLPEEDYLLEEDVDTIGFQPLICEQTEKVWYSNGMLKNKYYDVGVERNHPSKETMMRIRDLLVDGLTLTQDENCPLQLDGLTFVYLDGMDTFESTSGPAKEPSIISQPKTSFVTPTQQAVNALPYQGITKGATPSDATVSFTKDAYMTRMVDDLVGGDRAVDGFFQEHENLPPTPPEQTFDDTAFINDGSYGISTITAGETNSMTRTFSQMSHSADSAIRHSSSRPNQSAAMSPVIKQLPSLPSLPDQSSIWNRNYTSPGPSSPFAGHSTTVRNSPLRPAVNGHSRDHSLNSIRSFGPSPELWGQSPYQVSGSQQLVSSTLGWENTENNLAYQSGLSNYANFYGQDRTTSSPILNNGLMSPVHFGGSPRLHGQERNRSSYSHAPRNGNGG